jgi:hypothetical protein
VLNEGVLNEGVLSEVGGTPAAPPIDPHRPEPPRRLLRGSDRLAPLVGCRLLVGITYLDDAGAVQGAEQFCGQVLEVADGVVVVERPGAREPALLPADADAYEPAAAGRYTLRGSGEVVHDPDFVTTWQVAVRPAE